MLCDLIGLARVDDLFVIGLALDMTGAFLLARGLLGSPEAIVGMGRARIDYSPPLLVGRTRDQVDARFGMAALLAGFMLQAVAYVITTAVSVNRDTGWPEALFAAGVAGATAAVVIIAYTLTHKRIVRDLLPRIAYAIYDEDGWTTQKVVALRHLGIDAGYPEEPPESNVRYIERVFKRNFAPEMRELS